MSIFRDRIHLETSEAKTSRHCDLGDADQLTDNHGSELEALPHALPVDLVGKVGETDEAHEFLANYWRRARVRGLDERGIGWATVAILREGIAVATGIVGHLSEGAWAGRWSTRNAREAERLSASRVVVLSEFHQTTAQTSVVYIYLRLVAEQQLERFSLFYENT